MRMGYYPEFAFRTGDNGGHGLLAVDPRGLAKHLSGEQNSESVHFLLVFFPRILVYNFFGFLNVAGLTCRRVAGFSLHKFPQQI